MEQHVWKTEPGRLNIQVVAPNGRRLNMGTDATAERLAKEIVRACNAHDDLLNACHEALSVITEPGMLDVDEWREWKNKTVHYLRTAIAKATGQEE